MIDYESVYTVCELTTNLGQLSQLNAICNTALANQALYSFVTTTVKIPWPVIAAIHFREANQKFDCHLHNGDPLTARTTHVPKHRPIAGNPPFSWPESARDAFNGMWRPQCWDIAGCLEFMERYNGLGYQKHGILTPYLWDFTNAYVSGLFVADGSFDPNAKESRPGAVSILKVLSQRGVSLDFSALGSPRVMLH